MNPAVKIIEISAFYPLLALALVGVLSAVSLKTIGRGFTGKKSRFFQNQVDVASSPPTREGASNRTWDPRARILSALVFIFCTAYLRDIYCAAAALILSLSALLIARASLGNSAARLAAMSGFLGMLLLVLPLSVPAASGDTLLAISNAPGISINPRGLRMALLICLKASAIAFLVEILLGGDSFSIFLQALESLKAPPTVVLMIALTHRYIFVFGDESKRMLRGMRVRGFRGGSFSNTARAVGNLLGMLFVRSLERTERVHEAMLARGFSGRPISTAQFHAEKSDWAKALLLTGTGLALLIIDQVMG